jgi:uncharacterized protein involved in exopolysaccharide biosynthesis
MEDESGQHEEEESGGGGFNPDALKSYVEFIRRATRPRKNLTRLIVVVGLILTGLIVKYVPRTYTCTTVLMTVENAVLDEGSGSRPLAGASGLIMRHENLENLIKATNLLKKYGERRPPLMRLKDRLIEGLFGKMDNKTLTAVLVGTLEAKLEVTVDKDNLEIKVNWSDRVTAAELAEATKQGFLKLRHTAEISAFQEKMAILDNHATTLRQEVDDLAAQIKASLAAKAAEVAKSGVTPGGTKVKNAETTAGVLRTVRSRRPPADAELPELRAALQASKTKLAAAEDERRQRMSSERAKLDELKLRLTPMHPQVITQEERLGMASQVTSELALLRAEVADSEAQLRQREAMAATSGGATGASGRTATGAGGAVAEPLPSDILELLDREDTEPALAAQMSGAVIRYARLRDDVRGSKLALDTAQAAFNHRYQVVIPVEEPNKPSKPNILVIAIAGLVLSLLVGFIVPILLELRSGVIVEKWQVQHLQLPVLAELRLPANPDK